VQCSTLSQSYQRGEKIWGKIERSAIGIAPHSTEIIVVVIWKRPLGMMRQVLIAFTQKSDHIRLRKLLFESRNAMLQS
jgi:hypothetical protein